MTRINYVAGVRKYCRSSVKLYSLLFPPGWYELLPSNINDGRRRQSWRTVYRHIHLFNPSITEFDEVKWELLLKEVSRGELVYNSYVRVVMFSLGGKMKSIGGRSKLKEVGNDKGRLSNFIEVSRGKVLLLLRTAVLTPLPPGGIILL